MNPMSDLDSRCLDKFPEWLRTLSDDALAPARNFLFKSLDLIPAGIEDLGYLDDAFVFRVAAAASGAASRSDAVLRLAKDAGLVGEFLGADFARLEKYVGS